MSVLKSKRNLELCTNTFIMKYFSCLLPKGGIFNFGWAEISALRLSKKIGPNFVVRSDHEIDLNLPIFKAHFCRTLESNVHPSQSHKG